MPHNAESFAGNPSTDDTERRERQVCAEQVRMLFSGVLATFLASIFNACLLVFVQREIIAPPMVYGWLAYFMLVMTGRTILAYFYWRAPEADRVEGASRWEFYFALGAALSGLAWGGAGSLLYAPDSLFHQVFLVFVVGGMAAGGAAILFPRLSVAIPFLVFTLVPTLVPYFLSDDTLHRTMGTMLILYLLILLASTIRTNRTLHIALGLRYDNEGLIRNLRAEIDQRRQAEVALRESETRYRHLVNSAVDVIFTVRKDAVINSLSPSFTTTLGWDVSEWVGRAFPPIIYPDDLAAAMRYFALGLAGTAHQTFELRILAKSGAYVPMEFVLTPQHAGDAIVGVFGFARDITERKQTEAALKQSEEQLLQSQKMEAVGKLAGGIAHEFNNILQVIKGYCYFLLPELAQQESLRKDVEGIEQSADRAAGLTNQLLAFSRRQVIMPRVLDLNAIIVEQHRMLDRLIGESIKLEVELAPDLPRVKADPAQIGQVLLNLVNNARDAMPSGGVLTIATANRLLRGDRDAEYPGIPQGVYATLKVRDTGCGMPPAVLERIFEPFFTTKEVGKGTGLGLSTVYGLIAQIGGHIRVTSRPGQGTCFTILLPAVRQVVDDLGMEKPSDGPLTGTETILLAEDESAVRQVLHAALGAKGYQVLEAENGQAALQVCRDHAGPIHLAIVDLVMPMLGGQGLVRQLAPRYPNLKILYMSGYTDQPVDLQELPDVKKAFLQKPFSSEVLLRTVRGLLDES